MMQNFVVLLRSIACQLLIGSVLIAASPRPKVLLMTSISNHAEFIALQAQSFKKFLQDDYAFVVFNDGHSKKEITAIETMCASLNIPCISVPQTKRGRPEKLYYSRATYLHSEAITYMMQTRGFDFKGIVVLIDSDMFLVKKFSIVDFLGEHDIAGIRQNHNNPSKEYMWPGLMFFNMETLPSKTTIELHTEKELDTGGAIYHYFAANPTVKKLFFPQISRFRLSADRQPFYGYTCPMQHDYVACSPDCRASAEVVCPNPLHTATILQQHGFDQATINRIEQKQVPAPSEFLIGDTFFHLMSGSGYQDNRLGKAIVAQRHALLTNFLHDMFAAHD